jgi:hypothetical protein
MAKKAHVSSAGVVSVPSGATLYWNGGSGMCRDVGPDMLSEPVPHSSFVKVRMSSDSMVSLRCPNLSGERKERSNEHGAEGDQGKGGVVRAG